MSKKRRDFPPEFKFQVAMEYLSGQKRRIDVLREYQLSDSTLERWCQQLKERGPQVFVAEDLSRWAEREQRVAELERVVGRLTLELEAAKKASAWQSSRSRTDGA
jgi:transposase-like protein